MKKILSMICAAVMLVSMFSFVASAADAPIISFVNNGDGTIDIMLDTNGNDEVWAITANIDFSEAVTEGATVTATGANGVGCKYVKNKKMVQVSFTDTNMASYVESGKVGTVTLANWTADFTVKAMATPASGGTDYTNGNFNTNIVETLIKLPVSGPNWNKIDATVEEFESDENAEAGYAYGVEYTCAGAAAMIFAAGAEDARLYSNEITVEGAEGAVNVGFLSDEALENVGVLFRDADKANIWYSLDVDKH